MGQARAPSQIAESDAATGLDMDVWGDAHMVICEDCEQPGAEGHQIGSIMHPPSPPASGSPTRTSWASRMPARARQSPATPSAGSAR